MKFHHALRATVSVAAFLTAAAALPAQAQETSTVAVDDQGGSDTDTASTIVVTAKTTRSATAISSEEIQKILPGVSPLKAIQTLPGVLYITADPWGNNEQNAQIFIHGFNFQQLGYTMDGIPLGDQSYGNYNGLSPQRAVISENVGRVVVTTGAGDLGTASTSNLGGTVETFSADPAKTLGGMINQTVGSYGTSRTYLRLDSGGFGPGGENSAYVSGVRQRARAWDFNGIQGGWQANAKFVHDNAAGKLTVFFDYSDKKEPNEDATSFFQPSPGGTATAAQLYTPRTRPFFYSDLKGMRAYMDAFGNTPAAQGGNYRNYYSDAQRTDYLTYARYDAKLGDRVTWSNTGYHHHNDGVGVVAGPLGQSITVIQAYLDPNYATGTKYKANANASAALVAATGGSGLVTRTTEYRIDREGGISNLDLDFGAHEVQLGAWFEHNSATQWRRWYGLDVNNPDSSSPYIRPSNPLFTQYQGEARVDVLQLHVQDAWKVNEQLRVEAGVKTSAQWANGWFPVQPKAGSLSGLTGNLPSGRINTKNWFLPSVGATYDLNGHEQLYFNVQKNLHQYMAYLGGGSLSPWFTGSQSAFDAFAQQGKPETSWTYEGGVRTHRSFDGVLSGLDAQVNYYHVTFSNRLLAISTNPGGIAGGAITGGTSILVNVGSVHTDGVDAAFTLHFGRALSLYNATSYNSSTYQSDYSSTANGIGAAVPGCIGGGVVKGGVVPTCGKQVPGSPKWMNKSVATLSLGAFEAQVTGDYVGRRYATYANDTSVKPYFLTSLRLAAKLPAEMVRLKKAELSLNVTNLADVGGWSTISVGSATNSYSLYPIAPRQWFLTFSAGF
ncbi:TonB-dependent receptor plug domain-containing protein [uncultured Sphingomonas sp.]|uniref:TonB-dependent receptor n=1 Tax=uncultured Sphingomonas sp. TaxID=158754 RepID=UPI0025D4D672|nr:TonB-dependent receptor plug domain-containing protein [uncultured Sphingomonas sp.]